MATVDSDAVRVSLSSLNALAGKISPQTKNQSARSEQQNSNGLETDIDGDAKMNNGVLNTVRQPDHDAIKMFVGQIPRSMDEADLRKMFEEFGEVFQINVLRDKQTGVSKGCCFVTFYTRKAALEAQNCLHNIKTLQGMHHPIQMKPADTENRMDRKLFLGMLSKRYAETDVRLMFQPFGNIEDCSVLRDTNGQSKGCAFVTFSTRQSAIAAIKKLHHSMTMEGCSTPLVVKFADTPKEKDQKKLQQQTQNLWSAATSTNTLAALTPQYLAIPAPQSHYPSPYGFYDLLLQQSMGNGASNSSAGNPSSGGSQYSNAQHLSGLGTNSSATGNTASAISQLSNLNNLNSMSTMQQLLASAQTPSVGGQHQMFDSSGGSNGFLGGSGGSCTTNGGGLSSANNSNQEAGSLQSLLATITSHSSGLTMNMQNLAALAALASASPSSLQALTQPSFTNGMSSGLGSNGNNIGAAQAISTVPASNPAGKQIEGPPGANLFIYHLPQDFTDNDLAQCFWPYGKVISAKVFIDKQTNLSKCFGFVSYENPQDAQNAISGMNGQQVGNKRLKVQLKRPKDSRPY